MRSFAVLAGLLLVPSVVQACPLALGDGGTGIRVAYATGATSAFTRDPATGLIRELYSEADGYRASNELFLGLHLVSWSDFGPAETMPEAGADDGPEAGRSTYVFASDLPPDVAPGVTWSVGYRIEGAGAGLEGTYSGRVGAETRITIGPCTYLALPVDMYFRDAEFASLARVDYIPSLGFGVLVSWGELFGQPMLLTPTMIETVSGP